MLSADALRAATLKSLHVRFWDSPPASPAHGEGLLTLTTSLPPSMASLAKRERPAYDTLRKSWSVMTRAMIWTSPDPREDSEIVR